MLSESIKERQQRIEEFQEKIDKVLNAVFITDGRVKYSSRPDTRLRAS